MQNVAATALFVTLALHACGAAWAEKHTAESASGEDKTITKVVKMLQGILDASKTTGEEERTAYAKFMCDCDKRSTEYKTTIETSEEQISLLANQIAELKAENGKLSIESAQLTAAIAANLADQQSLNETRSQENAKFVEYTEDLNAAIGQLGEAISTLAEVSADQTLADATAKDHTKFMSGYTPKYNPVSLAHVRSRLKSALATASAFMDEKKAQQVASFMQAPFTGSYTSQSVEVMGILKNMKDTFEMNVAEATAQEAAQKKAWEEMIALKIAEAADMAESYDKKQQQLSSNDESLAAKKTQKEATENLLEEAETFLAETEKTCAAKKEEYSKRRLLQTQEEAALSEAIAILDSDASFATFGTVSATSTAALPSSFLQQKSIRKHSTENDSLQTGLMQILQKAKGSKRISKLMSVVQATNVFEVVLDEIGKMKELIVEEGKADTENLEFCNSERTIKDGIIAEKTAAIEEVLKPDIEKLTDDINHPETGLKKQISDTEASLLQNAEEQKTSTEERKEANLLYEEDMKNLAEAKSILSKAISVLQAYYKHLDEQLKLGLVQKRGGHREPKKNTPLPTFDTAVLKMEGESSSGKDVTGILGKILEETEKEEQAAMDAESAAVSAYEAEMASLKSTQTSLESSLATLEATLAETEQTLLTKKKELKTTEAEKAAAEKYLADIKPGCDFITANYDLRVNNRALETASLEAAVTFIKGTPTYAAYQAQVHLESLGTCVEACEPGEEKVECKACLADVTVPAYCAGHPEQTDCAPEAPPAIKTVPSKTAGKRVPVKKVPSKTAGKR